MRYICLLAVLLALPDTAAAQVAIRAGRGAAPPPAAAPEERTAVPKNNGASNAHQNERRNDRRNDRQNDRSNDRQYDRANDRPTSGLSPLGLPPARQQQMPWWEQRQLPWWEQQRTPSWERPSQEAWEQQLVNPSRAAIELNRKAREAARVQRRHAPPPVYYVLPPYRYFNPGTTYGYGVASTTYITPEPPAIVAPPPAPDVETGFLRLEVEPRQALQIFVDGLYIGTPADLGDEFEVRLGARRIELRAPGYRTLIFDTQIVPDRTIVYRGALEPITVTPASPAPPVSRASPVSPAPERSTIYLIPGCYIGNVAPTADMVRPGCDISKVITRSP